MPCAFLKLFDSIISFKKTSNNNTTYSSIERLDPAARLEEIAQMLSGGEISNAARENARALLN